MRILIVDDEIKICRLIEKLIDWEAINSECVGFCQNGIEAFESIKNKRPDIVITDIKMPGMDGLNLIKKTIENNMYIKFIIISGYKEFSYARTAMKYGVKHYLLKPIDKNELMSVIKDIKKQKIIERKNDNRRKIRESFILGIIYKHEKILKYSRETVNLKYLMKFNLGRYRVFVIKTLGEYIKNDGLSDTLYESLSENILEYTYDIEFVNDEDIAILVNYNKNNSKIIIEKMRNVLNEILYNYDLDITCGAGVEVANISDLYNSYKTANLATFKRLAYGNNKLIEYSVSELTSMCMTEELKKKKSNIIIEINRMNYSAIIMYINEIEESFSLNSQLIYVFDIISEITDLLKLNLKKRNLHNERIQDLIESYYKDVIKSRDMEDVFKNFKRIFNVVFDEIKNIRNDTEIRPIRIAKEYANKNYKTNISLKEVAEIVGYNESYFSYLFKEKTGRSYMGYIADLRVMEGKRLLLSTNERISDIAEYVGYNDIKSFNRKFKNLTGLNPSEYRKCYR